MTLIFWLLLTQTQFGRHRPVALIDPRLKTVLQNCKSKHTDFFSGHPELLLWILAVGSMICGGAMCSAGDKQIVEHKWFVKELAQICKRLQVQTHHQFISHLRHYLFLDTMSSTGLEMAISRLWGRALVEDNYCSVKINCQPHIVSQIAYAQSGSSGICKGSITSD